MICQALLAEKQEALDFLLKCAIINNIEPNKEDI